MIGSGMAIALVGGWAAGRVMSGQLFGVAPLHAPTIALATLLMAVVALAAAMVPASAVMRVEPRRRRCTRSKHL